MNTPSSKASRKAAADTRARLMVDLVQPLLTRGATLRELADFLTTHRVLVPSGRGHVWSHQTVAYLLKRAGAERTIPESPIGRPLRGRPLRGRRRPRQA